MSEEKACSGCQSESCSSNQPGSEESLDDFLEGQALSERLGQIKRKILVMSGKGGVGKSTVSANLAMSLALSGFRVGLLDIDFHGPSVPKLLKLEGSQVAQGADGLEPVAFSEHLKVMSIGFLLKNEDDALIWRGPMKMGVIKQFLKDVAWGELDYLVIDSPPGTGDEPLSVCQLIENADGAVVVTTPQSLAVADVRKSITFCRKLNLPVLGVVENMSGFVCPKCGELTDIFKSGGGKQMAESMDVTYLGAIPLDPSVVASCDEGQPFVYHNARSETAKAFGRVVRGLLDQVPVEADAAESKAQAVGSCGSCESCVSCGEQERVMRIAIPLADGKLALHFGHCAEFALLDVDLGSQSIVGKELAEAPAHEPGLLPVWLSERGVTLVIAGGMGMRAQQLFGQHGIKVVVGAAALAPEAIVDGYLQGTLVTGDNICDH